MHTKKTKLILLIISLFLLIFNSIQMFLSIGTASDLFQFSLTLSFLAFLYFKSKLKYADTYLFDITLTVCTLIVCLMTIIYSPRYYYKQSQKIIISEEYNYSENVSILDLNVKTIPVKPRINLLINRGYVIGLEENNNEVYYYFNPVTGEYNKMNNYRHT